MKLRTLAVSAAAAAAAASVALVPAAGASPLNLHTLLGMNEAAVSFVNDAHCDVFGPIVKASGMVNDGTTRGELITSLRNSLGDDQAVQVAATPTINAIGDKALECDVVQPDPLDPAALSSAVMNGDFTTIIDTLPSLSSQFNLDFDVPFPGLG
ncbi:hypothetical protein B841_04430 [Corynebacterium maris DSM 45190]|uniref:Secreted protein n=1 Tax=Corynebacterium maris DSM 45190 TaxID=1224163 RepID=S5T1D2_9CORY|nr:hypothetical protein [Corynebacterium maris]AGS34365.1 hypothetical protein B841_04430 [Corynebacterium maris DSM 45190]